MNMDEHIQKLKEIEIILLKQFPDLASDHDKQILARAVLLNEEVGELMDKLRKKYQV